METIVSGDVCSVRLQLNGFDPGVSWIVSEKFVGVGGGDYKSADIDNFQRRIEHREV